MKYFPFIIILQYVIQFPYENTQSITIPITINKYHYSIEFKAQIGINSIEKICKVDFKSSYSILFNSSSYNQEVSPSLNLISKSVSIEIKKNDLLYGRNSIETFHLKGIFNNLQLHFLYVSDTDYVKEEIDTYSTYLSFARTNTSFLSQLSLENRIKKRIVHFTHDYITIGELNKSIVSASH